MLTIWVGAVRKAHMIVFGKNYSYADAKSTGDSYRFAAKNLLATNRHSSASMLDDALTNVAWQSSLLADRQAKNKSGYQGILVDIFA